MCVFCLEKSIALVKIYFCFVKLIPTNYCAAPLSNGRRGSGACPPGSAAHGHRKRRGRHLQLLDRRQLEPGRLEQHPQIGDEGLLGRLKEQLVRVLVADGV